jgi:hypothetical protein
MALLTGIGSWDGGPAAAAVDGPNPRGKGFGRLRRGVFCALSLLTAISALTIGTRSERT